MKTSSFYYDLPDQLIARYPAEKRTDSRLLVVENGQESGVNSAICRHLSFTDLTLMLNPGDLLVFNNTRVIPARLFGRKPTGGRVEILMERMVDAHNILAHVRSSKSPKPGSTLILDGAEETEVRVVGRQGELFELQISTQWLPLLEAVGHMPLPPYIDREDEADDRERYQTVYAKQPGAVAAPTAGLHFDVAIIEALKQQGVEIAEVTLHVGAGTFQPVRVEEIASHHMHSEWMSIDQQVVDRIRTTKQRGNRVVAVGTTAVRTLESAAQGVGWQRMTATQGDTDIFIYPGFEFQVVDALLTNFHLPESTLLMLVSAFAGYSNIMSAYAEAVAEEYRFFSYGDAMFLSYNPLAVDDIPE